MVVGLSFVAQGSGISCTSTLASGCTFDFSVSGDTATLTKGPVTCMTTAPGAAVEVTYSTFTLTTSDGPDRHLHRLGAVRGTKCASTGTITATR